MMVMMAPPLLLRGHCWLRRHCWRWRERCCCCPSKVGSATPLPEDLPMKRRRRLLSFSSSSLFAAAAAVAALLSCSWFWPSASLTMRRMMWMTTMIVSSSWPVASWAWRTFRRCPKSSSSWPTKMKMPLLFRDRRMTAMTITEGPAMAEVVAAVATVANSNGDFRSLSCHWNFLNNLFAKFPPGGDHQHWRGSRW